MSAEIEKEQKEIAEALRLRGPSAPVTRVSRKALIIVGGVLSASLGGAIVWSTLERPARNRAEAPPVTTAGPPETVSSLPKDYLRRDEVPVLGPPLPGDLGRPILKASERTTPIEPSGVRASNNATTSPAMAALPRRNEVRGGQLNPRTSSIFLPAAARADHLPAAPPAAGMTDDPRLTSPERLQAPASPYILQAGAIIPAALITGLRSDAQGVALAQVTQDVLDSLGGGYLLIPAGSRLVGEYAAVTGSGQQRLAVAWNRLILPSGKSIVLDKLAASDPQGMAGLQDGVDRHWREVWAAAALSTVLSVGSEAGTTDESDLARAVRRGGSQVASDVGQQVVGRSLTRLPTLTVRPGAPLRVVLARDLVLEPYRAEAVR